MTRTTIELIRTTYALGDKDIPGLLKRWLPIITGKQLEQVLSYEVQPDICANLKDQIAQMEMLRDDLRSAMLQQEELLLQNGGVRALEYSPEKYWGDTYTILEAKYPWLTFSIFRKVRNSVATCTYQDEPNDSMDTPLDS